VYLCTLWSKLREYLYIYCNQLTFIYLLFVKGLFSCKTVNTECKKRCGRGWCMSHEGIKFIIHSKSNVYQKCGTEQKRMCLIYWQCFQFFHWKTVPYIQIIHPSCYTILLNVFERTMYILMPWSLYYGWKKFYGSWMTSLEKKVKYFLWLKKKTLCDVYDT